MRVFVAGGTGFVGHQVIDRLLAAGHQVVALVRPGSENKLVQVPGLEFHPGDALQPESLSGGMAGCGAVVNLIGIIREFPGRGITFERLHRQATENLLQAAREQQVDQFLQMSANGSREHAATDYHQTKWAAEQAVRASGLAWTIFRPSLIYGPDDQFVNLLAGLVKRLPVVPVLGDGRYRMSPITVEDVTRGFVGALENEAHGGQTYHCGGPQQLSYNEILDLIGRALGKTRVAKLHQPLALMKPVIALLEGFALFPITSTQLQMLLEGNTCDPAPYAEAFNFEPTPFYPGISRFLAASATASAGQPPAEDA